MSARRGVGMIKKFIRDERGATVIEYVLIATLVSVVIITALTQIGTKLSSQYINTVGNSLQ